MGLVTFLVLEDKNSEYKAIEQQIQDVCSALGLGNPEPVRAKRLEEAMYFLDTFRRRPSPLIVIFDLHIGDDDIDKFVIERVLEVDDPVFKRAEVIVCTAYFDEKTGKTMQNYRNTHAGLLRVNRLESRLHVLNKLSGRLGSELRKAIRTCMDNIAEQANRGI